MNGAMLNSATASAPRVQQSNFLARKSSRPKDCHNKSRIFVRVCSRRYSREQLDNYPVACFGPIKNQVLISPLPLISMIPRSSNSNSFFSSSWVAADTWIQLQLSAYSSYKIT